MSCLIENLSKPLDTHNLKKALHVLDTMNFTDEERMAYEDHLKWLRIEANTIEKARNKAKEEGEKIGRKEGKLEGEREKAFSIAKMMLEAGEPIEKIIRFTGLSESDI